MAKKPTAKKGEDGYFERNTKDARNARRVFATAEEFRAAADKYFDECDAKGELYGEAGLCLALSKYSRSGKHVSLSSLHGWYDGDNCTDLREAVEYAYLRIQSQIETDPRWRDKGVTPRAIFLQKQPRLGGYRDKIEEKHEAIIDIRMGDGMDKSDFG